MKIIILNARAAELLAESRHVARTETPDASYSDVIVTALALGDAVCRSPHFVEILREQMGVPLEQAVMLAAKARAQMMAGG